MLLNGGIPEFESILGPHSQSPYVHGQLNLLDRAVEGTENDAPKNAFNCHFVVALLIRPLTKVSLSYV